MKAHACAGEDEWENGDEDTEATDGHLQALQEHVTNIERALHSLQDSIQGVGRCHALSLCHVIHSQKAYTDHLANSGLDLSFEKGFSRQVRAQACISMSSHVSFLQDLIL